MFYLLKGSGGMETRKENISLHERSSKTCGANHGWNDRNERQEEKGSNIYYLIDFIYKVIYLV